MLTTLAKTDCVYQRVWGDSSRHHSFIFVSIFSQCLSLRGYGRGVEAPVSKEYAPPANVSPSCSRSPNMIIISSVVVRSIDDPMVLETKSAELVNLKDGTRSTLNMASFENGTVTYTFVFAGIVES